MSTSGGPSGWARRCSPSPGKTGPMKATLPMSSLTRQNSANKKSGSNSPSISPTTTFWKNRISPDPNLSGLRSPGAINYKGQFKTLRARIAQDFSSSSLMRRTASLDTIYLTGQWPRETLYLSNLQVDRSTQTEELLLGESRKCLRHQDSGNEDKLEKFIRHRMQRAKEGSSRERTAALTLLGNDSHISHKHRMRSSIEGLNQEIERLVLRSSSSLGTEREERKSGVQSTPEGHRAPVADLLRQTRSVNTQTPAYTNSTHSSGPPSRESNSPGRPGSIDSRPSSDLQGIYFCCLSEDSSPEQEGGKSLGTSPRINKFFAREPPDGCERVNLRFTEEARRPMVDISTMDYPLKPSVNFQLKPSLGSAFQPLRTVPTPEPTTQ